MWNTVRGDNYNLNRARSAVLPKEVVGWMAQLQKARQRYIVLREVPRYKRLLLSLPEWDFGRVASKAATVRQERGAKTLSKLKPMANKPVTGIEGYSGMKLDESRYWFAEE